MKELTRAQRTAFQAIADGVADSDDGVCTRLIVFGAQTLTALYRRGLIDTNNPVKKPGWVLTDLGRKLAAQMEATR